MAGPGKRRGLRILANALLVLGSTLLAYYAIEFAFFRFLLPRASINLMAHLPDTADVLVQNAKSHYVPLDYIALLGDSYAEGVGDWLLQANGDRAKPFHSANVIHDATGRDVASFGREGNSSAQALVRSPARIFAGTRCFIFPRIEPPREMFIYYYEGNDANDNVDDLAEVRKFFGTTDDRSIDAYLQRIASVPEWRCHVHLLDTMWRMAAFTYRYRFEGITLPVDRPKENALLVAGQTIGAPALQGPAPGLDDRQIEDSMRMLARSLSWLKSRFPGVPVTLVFVPSPLSTYRLAKDTAVYQVVYEPGRPAPVPLLKRHSDLMCNLVHRTSRDWDIGFLDARPALRAAASTRVIHGPRDWYHFNEAGYRVLGDLVVDRLNGDTSSGACSQAVPD
jgi:hypothetical protein